MLKIKLEDKVVVITGGSKGLGKELAMIFALEKSRVIICSRNKAGLKTVYEEIIKNGGKCSYFVVDVTNKAQVNRFIDNILKSHDKIDILINNAGYAGNLERLESVKYSDLEKIFKTNVYSMFYLLKKVVPIMRKQKTGIIINVSSTAGKRAVPNLSVYSASKFAVIGLTQALAKELENTDVRCIALCPGGMNTEMRSKIFGKEDAEKQQDAAFVAKVVKDIATDKIKVPNGGDIVVRHGKVTSINLPADS